jgi:hypothetical protein
MPAKARATSKHEAPVVAEAPVVQVEAVPAESDDDALTRS